MSVSDNQPKVKNPVDPRVKLVSVDEASRRLGVGRSTIYKLISSGKLGMVSIYNRRLIREDHIDALAEHGTGEME